LSGHALPKRQLDQRKRHEEYLAPVHNFHEAIGEELGGLDGSYVVIDIDRQLPCRGGETVATFQGRWAGHMDVSQLKTKESLRSTFYLSYPHETAISRSTDRLGTFQQLKQGVGIGFHKSNKQELVSLFDWDSAELQKLQPLASTSGDAILDRQYYWHLAYLCEAAYAVAIKPEDNLSGNPTCEWQLHYFGNSNE
jgi:hypothetical protein